MRKDRRSRALKAGKILLPSGGVLDCTIRDVSATGAKLRLSSPSPVPEAFELLFSTERTARPAERRWQRGVDVGVTFTGPARKLDPE